MKKIFSIVLIPGLIIIAGCGPRQVEEAKPSTREIVIWHWMPDREKAFDELAKKYKDLTGVEVRCEVYAPSDIYSQKIRGAAYTRTLPDIYGILGEKEDFAAFIKAGHVLNLSDYMDADEGAWRRSLFKRAVSVNQFSENNDFGVEPGIYGVPVDVMNIQILYNKDLFRKAGLDPERPPKTWDEFLQAGRKLKAAGITGMVSGWSEVWMIDCFASNYAYNIMGEAKYIDTIRGNVPYTDSDWIKVFELFKEMNDNHLLAKGIVSMINKYAEQMFANERAALAFNGSWCVNVYHGMNPDLDYGVMLPPPYSGKYPMMIWGGAGTSFMVNARSANKEEAVKFLRWITSKDQQEFLASQTRNLPSNKESLENIPELLAQFADDMDRTTHPNNLPVSEFPRVIEAKGKGIQSIIIGEKSPQEVALDVQAVKVREMEKAKVGK
jgi:ABC-type glycerol-3-phosphate transport system substrate-binding protein